MAEENIKTENLENEAEQEATQESEADLSDLEDMFGMDEATLNMDVSISEDMSGFANGFPDWDIHPPKK